MKKLWLMLMCAGVVCACNEKKDNAPTDPGESEEPVNVEPQEPQDPQEPLEPKAMRTPKVISFASAQEQLKYRTNEFTFNLLDVVSSSENKPNIVLSPLSASMLLGMVMNGSTGETQEQMQKMLGFAGLTEDDINSYYMSLMADLPNLDESTIVKLANSIWVDNAFPVYPSYIDLNRQVFGATSQNVAMTDPATADIINLWADQNTNHLISEVVKAEEIQSAIMILANALYFKGLWEEAFQKDATTKKAFTLRNGSKVEADMMMNWEAQGRYAELAKGQLMELDYKGGHYCMDIFLPKEGEDILAVLANLTMDDWNECVKELYPAQVVLGLPRVKLYYERDLTKDLKAAGMVRAFDVAKAQFNRISSVPTFLSAVKQFCYLAVDEEGTEASAVTIGEYEATAMPSEAEMIVDRPYLMVIRERERDAILFVALVTNPNAN